MRDINFFEPYVVNHKGKEKKEQVLFGLVIILGLIIISFPTINFIRIYRMEKEISSINNILQSTEAVEQMQRIRHKESRIEALGNQLNLLVSIDQGIENLDIINEILIDNILSTLPENLFLQTLYISSQSINIQGVANDKTSIAEFEYNIRSTKAFDDIYIPSITLNKDIYNFTIQFKVKDVN